MDAALSHFAENLQDLISESKKTIKQLSKDIKISEGSLSKYQNNIAEAGIGSLVKIAQYFNVTTDFLLGLSGAKSPDIDIQGIHKKTGLSEESINKLMSIPPKKPINYIITSPFFDSLIEIVSNVKVFKFVDSKAITFKNQFVPIIPIDYLDKFGFKNGKQLKEDLIENLGDKISIVTGEGAVDFMMFNVQRKFNDFLEGLRD